MKNNEGQELLRETRGSLVLDENTRQDIKKFRKARASRWKKMKKKSITRLFPEGNTLN